MSRLSQVDPTQRESIAVQKLKRCLEIIEKSLAEPKEVEKRIAEAKGIIEDIDMRDN